MTFMSSLAQSAWHAHTHEHWDGVGGVGQKGSCLLYLNLLGTRKHMNIGMGWLGWVGWGGTIMFMSSLSQSAWHTRTHEHWDGVGWVGWDGTITLTSSLSQSAGHTQTHEH